MLMEGGSAEFITDSLRESRDVRPQLLIIKFEHVSTIKRNLEIGVLRGS